VGDAGRRTDQLKDNKISVNDAGNRVADKLDDLEALNAILIDEPAAIETGRREELDMTIFILPKE
jgi:septum formation inhibitor-activating ATPase MinD